ncbi:MAG: hypothetical protein AAGA48_17390 [Myxococcota bacterium]
MPPVEPTDVSRTELDEVVGELTDRLDTLEASVKGLTAANEILGAELAAVMTATERVGVRLERWTQQPIAVGEIRNTVVFAEMTEIGGTEGFGLLPGTSDPSTIVVPTEGIYMVMARVGAVATNFAHTSGLYLRVDGEDRLKASSGYGINGGWDTLTITDALELQAGQELSLQYTTTRPDDGNEVMLPSDIQPSSLTVVRVQSLE